MIRRGDTGRPARDTRRAFVAGMRAATPMLLGVVPFGLVAGAAPIATGLDLVHALGLSALLFAGASQLAVIDVLDGGGGAAVAIVTALTINLRLLLYSASIAPWLSDASLGSRLRAGYLLVDQVYALAIVHWDGDDDPRLRLPYFFGIGSLLWCSWMTMTTIGAVVGDQLPDDIPLEFAVPLVFLVLLVPALTTSPAIIAAAVGGGVAVVAAETGAARLAIVIGGVAGIVAGTVAETLQARRAAETEGAT